MTETFSKEATAKFPKTVATIVAGELYVHCPDCRGEGLVYAYRDCNDHSSGEYFSCPSCLGTKEQDADDAVEFLRKWERQQGIDA